MTWLGSENDDIFGDIGFSFQNAALQRTMMGESQFFAFESFFLPKTIKELFQFSYYAFITNETINPAIEKLASYPITEFLFSPRLTGPKDTKEYMAALKSKEDVITAWEDLFDTHLMAKGFAVKISSNFYLYGNAFVSVYQPFDRILICGNQQCREHYPLTLAKWEWDPAKLNFTMKCQKCGFKGTPKVFDKIVADPNRINLISYYPGNVDIDYDPYSGCKEYYYTVPEEEVEKIKKGNPLKLRVTPWDIIEAVRLNRGRKEAGPKIKLRSDNIFHLARHTADMPGAESPWGMPITVAVLRLIFYLNMMRRAQTALMMEHILPFRFLFPGVDTGVNTTMPMDLGDWRKRMRVELKKWKRDPLYIMLSPVPLGQGQMGGDGKALMLFPEMQMVTDGIIGGLNTPVEFIKGGLQFTGTSVSLRMLENMLLGQVEQITKCMKWIVKRVSLIGKMELVNVTMKRFKMADDIQMRQLLFQMWQTGAISGEHLGQEMEFDFADEMRKRQHENIEKAVADAKAQAEAANRMMVLQSLLQATLAPEMQMTAPPIDPAMVDQVYQGLGKIKDPAQQDMYIQQLGQANPDLARELKAKAMTDMNSYGQQLQTMLAMAPDQRLGYMDQMSRDNPVMGLILANLMKNFGLEGLMQGANPAPQEGGQEPGKDKKPGGKVEKSSPEQRPPRRQGGAPV